MKVKRLNQRGPASVHFRFTRQGGKKGLAVKCEIECPRLFSFFFSFGGKTNASHGEPVCGLSSPSVLGRGLPEIRPNNRRHAFRQNPFQGGTASRRPDYLPSQGDRGRDFHRLNRTGNLYGGHTVFRRGNGNG